MFPLCKTLEILYFAFLKASSYAYEKEYNMILHITKRKQVNIVHKFLELIFEYLSQLMLLFGFIYESKLS